MASQFVYWTSDGGGEGGGGVARVLSRWIRTRASPSLIVYGGDVYHDGKAREFDHFRQQVGDLSLMCETAGNHDWHTDDTTSATGRFRQATKRFGTSIAPRVKATDRQDEERWSAYDIRSCSMAGG